MYTTKMYLIYKRRIEKPVYCLNKKKIPSRDLSHFTTLHIYIIQQHNINIALLMLNRIRYLNSLYILIFRISTLSSIITMPQCHSKYKLRNYRQQKGSPLFLIRICLCGGCYVYTKNTYKENDYSNTKQQSLCIHRCFIYYCIKVE